ncbi:uncharacterized protein LOC107369774 isoform X2 [Tetranychus urticae]|uniref:uncharacterized protein LOC107369774 isoform X2 n=1 Tax=Tetranychus urticae TaxID=32264 RepID=UPI00077BD8B9|nr:uncharacterized protein LOC107369774 isoform X2 [Tetranychus urticae]
MDSTTNDPNQFSTYDLSYLSNTTADSGNVVYLLVYDLSHGMAKHFSLIFLGKQIDAIYHTSIVYFGVEYFFGQDGICAMPYSDGCNNMGRPISKICLGYSEIPLVLFQEYISTLNSSTFGVGTYDLFKHNCNNFSNEVAQFLTGVGIPEEIINLPSEVLSTNFGQILSRYQRPLENQINQSVTSVNNPADWRTRTCQTLRETLRKTRKRQKEESTDPDLSDDRVEIKPKRKAPKYSDPPIVYADVDGVSAVKKILELVGDALSEEERHLMDDWTDYLKTSGEAWKIDDDHLSLISRLLSGEDGKFPPNVPLLTLEILQSAALKDDFVLALHGDRKNHRLMSYIYKIESLTLAEQEEIAKLLCNFCFQPCSFDWLMYISEWTEPDGSPASNSRVTIRVAVHTLLNDKLTTLQKVGVDLIFNLSLRELFEESATELATAVLQYLHLSNLDEDRVFLCLTALVRFMAISLNEVPALTQMLGPDINKFRGTSKRIDELVEQINVKLAAINAKASDD